MALVFIAKKKRPKITLDLVDKVAILYVLFITTSSLTAGNIGHSVIGGPYRFQGIITQLFLVLVFLTTRRVAPKIETPLIIGASLQSGLALLQFIQLNIFKIPLSNYSGRVIGTFGEPNFMAGFILAGLVLSLGKFVTSKKYSYLTIASINILGLLVSESMGTIMVLSLIIPILIYRITKKFWSPFLIVPIIAISLIAGYEKERITFNSFGIPTVESRLSIWPAALDLIFKRPPTGYGAENMAFVFPAEFGGTSVDRAHNVILDQLMLGGVPVLLIYLFIFWQGVLRSWKSPTTFPIALVLIALFIKDQVNVSGIVNLYTYWMLLGVGMKVSPFIHSG